MQSQGLPCYHKRASRHYLNLVDFRLYIFPQYLPKTYFNIIILSLLQSVFFLWGVSINFCINCSAPRCVLHVLLFLSSFVLASLIILVKGMNCESHNYVFFSPLTCYFTSHTCFVFFFSVLPSQTVCILYSIKIPTSFLHRVYVFVTFLRIYSCYFPKPHWYVGLYNGDRFCFLWGRSWNSCRI